MARDQGFEPRGPASFVLPSSPLWSVPVTSKSPLVCALTFIELYVDGHWPIRVDQAKPTVGWDNQRVLPEHLIVRDQFRVEVPWIVVK